MTFSHSPVKVPAFADWRLCAKSEDCPLGTMFQSHPPSLNERSTTQASLSSMNPNSFGFDSRPFRKLNFEEEPVDNAVGLSKETAEVLAKLKEKRPETQTLQSQGVSREAMEVIKQIRAKGPAKEQGKGFVPCGGPTGDLPSEYRRLLVKFETFENTLFFHVFRRIPTFFKNLNRDS